MKKHKGLSRIFIMSYFVIIFCGVLFGLLLVKYNLALALVIIGLEVLDLAAFITSKHLFSSHYLAFFIISLVALSFLNISVIGALVLESILTASGEPAPYAWMIIIIAIGFMAIIDYVYPTSLAKIHHKRLIEEGVIEPEAEEEV